MGGQIIYLGEINSGKATKGEGDAQASAYYTISFRRPTFRHRDSAATLEQLRNIRVPTAPESTHFTDSSGEYAAILLAHTNAQAKHV
jgi:hypothetical protein